MQALKLVKGFCQICFVAALVGCGGGGGGASGVAVQSNVIPLPLTGSYAWLLHPQGLASAPQFGLSLIHPSNTTIEYVIEPATNAISDMQVISAGTVNAAGLSISNIQPHALFYITAGDIRRVPLIANGKAPATQVVRTSTTTACKFLHTANDYTTPDQSRFIVSIKGLDNQCGTADDELREVAFNATTGISLSAIGAKVIGVLHNSTTLLPCAWVVNDGALFWANTVSRASSLVMRVNTSPLFSRVVSEKNGVVVAEYNNQLTVLRVLGAPPLLNVTETVLNAALTAGAGWQAIGFDANSFYVYRNSGNTTTSTWSVLKISIATPVATQLASGTGYIGSASMGTNFLYTTVLGTASNTVLKLDKVVTGVPSVLETNLTTDLSTVTTSASGIHQRWRVVNVNTNPSYTIEMIDESNVVRYSAAGGFPIAIQEAATINTDVSENRNRYLFATGYGLTSRQFGDSSLVMYDTTQLVANTLATLPGTVDFGANPVYASVMGSVNNFTAGVAMPLVAGTLQSATAKVFSVDTAVANSLKYTTTKQ
jgi:hypothetical protein